MTTKAVVLILSILWALSMAFAAYVVFRPATPSTEAQTPDAITGHVFSVRYFAVDPSDQAAADVALRLSLSGDKMTFTADGRLVYERAAALDRMPYTKGPGELTFDSRTYKVDALPDGAILSDGGPLLIRITKLQ